MSILSFYGGPASKDFTIAKIFDSKASLDADIAAAADLGIGQNYWSIGDTKEVTLNGSVGYGSSQATFNNTKYWVYIIGFDHNSAKEGKGIAFQGFKTAQNGGVDIAVAATNYGSSSSGMVMNGSSTNVGGWNGSWAHTACMGQWKNCFPSDLQAVILTFVVMMMVKVSCADN